MSDLKHVDGESIPILLTCVIDTKDSKKANTITRSFEEMLESVLEYTSGTSLQLIILTNQQSKNSIK